MQEQFVPYDIALRMKELGFDEECVGLYLHKEFRIAHFKSQPSASIGISAPLYQQAFDWFRENKGLVSYIHPLALLENTNEWAYEITNFKVFWDENFSLQSYEEARLECLKELIKIVENGK